MAPFSELYAIATGFNTADVDLDLLTTIVTRNPSSQPLPDGSVKEQTLDGHTQINGARKTVWEWAALTFTEFAALSPYFGAAATVKTRDGLSTFGRYNAYMDDPQSGEDYQVDSGWVLNLRWGVDIIGAAT